MKKILMIISAAFLVCASALTQAGGSSPGLYYGQVPTAAQWNSYFASKLDYTPGGANMVPYWDGAGSLLNAAISGDCTATANVFTCAATSIKGGTQWGVLYQSAAGVTASTAAGSAGYVLTSNATSAPTFQSIGAPFATAIHAATSKTAPADADEFAAASAADGYALRKLAWSDIRSTINDSDNPVINGEMLVDQANNGGSISVTANTAVAAIDMWYVYSATAAATAQQVAGQGGFKKALQLNGAASVTSQQILTRIESINAARFVNSTVTVTVNIANTLLSSVTWTARYPNVADTFTAETQIATGVINLTAADSTLRQYTFSFNAGASAGNGIQLEFTVGAQTSGYWQITGIDMVGGTNSRPYPHINYALELLRCKRYLPSWNRAANADRMLGAAYSTTISNYSIPFDVEPRTPPTGIQISAAGDFTVSSARLGTTGAATGVVLSVAGYKNATIGVTTTAGTPALAAGDLTYLFGTSGAASLLFTGSRL